MLAIVASLLSAGDFPTSGRVHAQEGASAGGKQDLPGGSGSGGQPNRPGQSGPGAQGTGSVKSARLESQLAETSLAARSRGAATALQEAQGLGLSVVDEKVRVVIEAAAADEGRARSLVASVGGTFESHYEALSQALVPVTGLALLEVDPFIRWVRSPIKAFPQAVTGQGVAASGAQVWHAANQRGAGVKVAVADVGFLNYPSRITSGELRNVAGTFNFGCASVENGENHGTQVAEIVSEMAPDATLYLMCVGGNLNGTDAIINSGNAKNQAKALGVHIFQMSMGWAHDGRGDGTGSASTMDGVVKDARDSGILWVNSAGNSARGHWHGTFATSDGDQWHDFTPGDELNVINPGFDLRPNEFVALSLVWNSWPTSSQDYDLFLYQLDRTTGAVLGVVTSSTAAQTGTQPPREFIAVTNTTGVTVRVAVAIKDFNREEGLPFTTPRMDLFKWSPYGDIENFEYFTRAGSLTFPGAISNVMSVAAICWQNDRLEDYSSQGPTPDGRLKPDIAGQSVVSTSFQTFTACPAGSSGTGGFNGTSAAAPHVSGAAALVKGANPGFTPAQVQAFLEGRAIDLGTAGKDALFGSGKLQLGAVPTPPVACSPRPAVTVQTAIGGGRLAVTVVVSGANNRLVNIVFGNGPRVPTNALLDLPDGRVGLTGTPTWTATTTTTTTTFWVRRQTPGLTVTVPFVVNDLCGGWPTFVGGGTGPTAAGY